MELPMELGDSTGPGGGAHEKWVQCANHTGTIDPASCTLTHTNTRMCAFCANFTLGT